MERVRGSRRAVGGSSVVTESGGARFHIGGFVTLAVTKAGASLAGKGCHRVARGLPWLRSPGGRRFLVAVVFATALFVSGTALPGAGSWTTRLASGAHTTVNGVRSAGGPTITLNRTKGPNFDDLRVTLGGFAFDDFDGQAVVNVTNATVPSYVISSDPFFYINSSGGSSGQLPAIQASPGEYLVTAYEPGVPSVSTAYNLTLGSTSLVAVPSNCGPGNSVLVTGTNFPTDYPFTIFLGSPTGYDPLLNASPPDTVNGCVRLPSEPSGPFILFVTDENNYFYAATPAIVFPILPLVLTPSQGVVGTLVTASGGSFPHGSHVIVYWAGGTACTSVTNTMGFYTCSFTLPATSAGAYTVTAKNGTAPIATGSFIVTTPRLQLVPGQGPEEAYVDITGYGFSVHAPLASLTLGGIAVVGPDCLAGSLVTGTTGLEPGEFSCWVLIPNVLPEGLTVVATDHLGPSAIATFEVTAPSLSFSHGQGPAGATVTIYGHGFSVDSQLVSLTFGGAAIASGDCGLGSLVTGTPGLQPGEFSCTTEVPDMPAGATTVTAVDVTRVVVTTSFLVTIPVLSLSPSQGPEGTVVTVTGHGFSVDTTAGSFLVGMYPAQPCSTGSLTTGGPGLQPGEFSCTSIFSALSPGSNAVSVTDVSGGVATAIYTLTIPTLVVTPTSGPVGSTVTLIGHGFSVDTPLQSLSFDDVLIYSCPLGGSFTTGLTGLQPGEFVCAFAVPSGTIGPDVDAIDVTGSYAAASFDVT